MCVLLLLPALVNNISRNRNQPLWLLINIIGINERFSNQLFMAFLYQIHTVYVAFLSHLVSRWHFISPFSVLFDGATAALWLPGCERVNMCVCVLFYRRGTQRSSLNAHSSLTMNMKQQTRKKNRTKQPTKRRKKINSNEWTNLTDKKIDICILCQRDNPISSYPYGWWWWWWSR